MSLEDVPSVFADYFGINETTGQLLLSLVVIFTLLLPTMYLAKGKNAVTIWLIATFLVECVVLGLGWLPFWIMTTTIIITVLGMAVTISKAIGG